MATRKPIKERFKAGRGDMVDRETAVEAAPSLAENLMSEHPDQFDHRMWAQAGENFFPCKKAIKELVPGQYVIRYSQNEGLYFTKTTVNVDDLLELPDSATEKVLTDISEFWEREEYFRKFGYLWKRGIFLWGPPGGGKTSCVQLLAREIIRRGGISVYASSPASDAAGLALLREIEPNRPIIVIMEDIDAIVQEYGEADLLALLDGELQIDNVVFVATTNYPERLDKRVTNRPSRFDEIIKIGMPSADARGVYLSAKHPELRVDKERLKTWVDSTQGFSIAHLKEVIASVECLGRDFDETIKRLRQMMDIQVTSDEPTGHFGFTHDRDD